MTVSEIAKRAGVSIGTVDRVIHKRGRVSDETREKIEAILEEGGYRPNPLARHLKRARPYNIGVLMPGLDDESHYWRQVHKGLLDAKRELAAFAFDISLYPFSRDDEHSLERAFASMCDAECDAWIVAPVLQGLMNSLLGSAEPPVPLVCIDSPLPGACATVTIAQDPRRGGQLAARLMRLVSRSPGPFATVRPYEGAFNLDERVRGFRRALVTADSLPSNRENAEGFSPLDVVCPALDSASVAALVDRLLIAEPALGGIFVASSIGHLVARQVCARGRHGDIPVIAWDLVDENVVALDTGELDCVIAQRPFEQGRLALHELYRVLILGEDVPLKIDIPLDIHFKENIPEDGGMPTR